jgi:DNA gyrase subunit B
MTNMHPDPAIMNILDRLENVCGEEGGTGRITYIGVFSSGGRQSTWIKNETNTDDLLRLIENRMAEIVLNCIGNSDRLNILLALLRKPMTVAALVEKCGYNSTGQVYHHLKPLLAADLVTEDKHSAKGTYIVKPHRVQGIIMLLAGIRDMLDIEFS